MDNPLSVLESALEISLKNGEARFAVHARPRAKRSALVALRSGALVVALAAPPVDGAANDELVALLGRVIGVKRSDASVVRGASSRSKVVSVRRLDGATVRERIAAAIPEV